MGGRLMVYRSISNKNVLTKDPVEGVSLLFESTLYYVVLTVSSLKLTYERKKRVPFKLLLF